MGFYEKAHHVWHWATARARNVYYLQRLPRNDPFGGFGRPRDNEKSAGKRPWPRLETLEQGAIVETSEVWWPQWRLRHHATSAQELEQLTASGGMAVGFAPVVSGENPLIITGAQSRFLSVWRTLSGCGFVSQPKMNADVVTIRLVDSGQLHRADLDNPLIAERGDITLTRFPTLVTETATKDFSSTAVTLERGALETAYRLVKQRECEFANFEQRITDADLGARTIRRGIARIYHHVSEGLEQSDHTAIFIRDLFLLYIVAFWPLRGETPGPATPQTTGSESLRTALRYIQQNLPTPLTLSEISSAANVGPRALQMSFKRDLGVTPLAYIIRLRLDAVRRDLEARDQDQHLIRTIAERWGFTNMSDFAQRFKDAFGKSPRKYRADRD